MAPPLTALADTSQRQLTVLAYLKDQRSIHDTKVGFRRWLVSNKISLPWTNSEIGAAFRHLQDRGLIHETVATIYRLTEEGENLIQAHFRALGFLKPTLPPDS